MEDLSQHSSAFLRGSLIVLLAHDRASSGLAYGRSWDATIISASVDDLELGMQVIANLRSAGRPIPGDFRTRDTYIKTLGFKNFAAFGRGAVSVELSLVDDRVNVVPTTSAGHALALSDSYIQGPVDDPVKIGLNVRQAWRLSK